MTIQSCMMVNKFGYVLFYPPVDWCIFKNSSSLLLLISYLNDFEAEQVRTHSYSHEIRRMKKHSKIKVNPVFVES